MTRYELLDRIGVGGMAEIFRGKAVAAGGFEKPVAIKRILPHLSQDQRFVELLIAEAKVLSLLKHRNIVQIFDVGLGDDGKYFLVMEYVDGKDIGAVQRSLETQRRRVPYDLVLHIGAEICEALEVAHSSRGPDGRPMNLVHRDVSPSNVILSRAGEVKLTDFGIAKRAESEQTRGGAVRGKFAYISPEQARNEHLDPRSDVFSVGILLWELFVNRRLFSGLPDMEALRGVREANIPPPTQADSRLPKAIDTVVMQALAKDKTRRFASAGELGTKLRQMRYALDVTVGDPATEVARIVEATIDAEKQKPVPAAVARDFDASEATVFRIRTDDRFSEHEGLQQARQVIDRFEDEETRLADLSGDQLRALRSPASPSANVPRKRAPTDEPTRARPPLSADEIAAIGDDDLPNAHLTPTDATKLVVSRDRRTPVPQRARPAGPAPNAPLTLDEPSRDGWKPAPTSSATHMLPHDPALDAPLTLEDSEAPSRSVSRSRSQSQSQSQSKSMSRAPSVSQHSVSRSQSASQHSQSASQSVSRSVPAPLTLEPTPASPPQLPPAPIVAPIVPVASQLPTPPPVAPAPQLPAAPQSRPSFSGWGPPIAAQIRPPTAQPVPQAPPKPPAPSQRPPTTPPPATTTLGGGLASLGFRPWMLIVGAVIVALAAFAITRAFIR
ncbi:MAG TPA: protein kinase [Kofleriaceae bacterium]|nr:protein kinase [Kofleriaceae bacterium]